MFTDFSLPHRFAMGMNYLETLCDMPVLLPHIQNIIYAHLLHYIVLAWADREQRNNTNKQANKQ